MDSETPKVVEATTDFVFFTLASERYAVESAYVREVYPVTVIAPLPCVPSYWVGIINVRGDIVGVLDLRAYFRFEALPAVAPEHVIIAKANDAMVGVLVDSVTGTGSLLARDLTGGGDVPGGGQDSWVKRIHRDELIVLDLAQMLADPRFHVNEQVSVMENEHMSE